MFEHFSRSVHWSELTLIREYISSETLLLKCSNMTLPPEGIHLPGTRSYEDAVRLWNGGIDRRPAMVCNRHCPRR